MLVDDLMKMFDCDSDAALGRVFGRKKGAVSVWRSKGVPAAIQVKAKEIYASRHGGDIHLNGDSNSVNIHHSPGHVNERPEQYSPAKMLIDDIIDELDEPQRRKLAGYVLQRAEEIKSNIKVED